MFRLFDTGFQKIAKVGLSGGPSTVFNAGATAIASTDSPRNNGMESKYDWLFWRGGHSLEVNNKISSSLQKSTFAIQRNGHQSKLSDMVSTTRRRSVMLRRNMVYWALHIIINAAKGTDGLLGEVFTNRFVLGSV